LPDKTHPKQKPGLYKKLPTFTVAGSPTQRVWQRLPRRGQSSISNSSSDSPYVNSVEAEVPGSFSAFTVYRNLSEEEKEKYTHIKTSVEQQAGDSKKTTEFEYTIQKLKTLEAKLYQIKPLQENLKHRHYDQLTQRMDSSAFRSFDIKTFYAQLDTIASACGEINDYQFHAFTFFELEVNQEQKVLLELKGVLLRSK
jgi:hypothetical protein